jgi:hypothetical protein
VAGNRDRKVGRLFRQIRGQGGATGERYAKSASGMTAVAATLMVLGSLGSAGVSEAGSVYRYMDAEGVTHFSDSPVDDRYNRIRIDRQEGVAISARPALRNVPTQGDYDRLIVKVALRHGVPAGLVKAVIAAESNFQPDAVSRVGAQGLMQLMPETAADLGVERPFGVVENIDGGVRYLRLMLDRYGDVTRALAAYNAGPKAVDRYKGVPPYRETQTYVKRVLRYYRSYRLELEEMVSAVTASAPGGFSARAASAGPVVRVSRRHDEREFPSLEQLQRRLRSQVQLRKKNATATAAVTAAVQSPHSRSRDRGERR